jgi:hypothetical protein
MNSASLQLLRRFFGCLFSFQRACGAGSPMRFDGFAGTVGV